MKDIVENVVLDIISFDREQWDESARMSGASMTLLRMKVATRSDVFVANIAEMSLQLMQFV